MLRLFNGATKENY